MVLTQGERAGRDSHTCTWCCAVSPGWLWWSSNSCGRSAARPCLSCGGSGRPCPATRSVPTKHVCQFQLSRLHVLPSQRRAYRIRRERRRRRVCSRSAGRQLVQLATQPVLAQAVVTASQRPWSPGLVPAGPFLLCALAVIYAGQVLGMSRSHRVVSGGGKARVGGVEFHQRPLLLGECGRRNQRGHGGGAVPAAGGLLAARFWLIYGHKHLEKKGTGWFQMNPLNLWNGGALSCFTSLLSVESLWTSRRTWLSMLLPDDSLAKMADCISFSLCFTITSQAFHSLSTCWYRSLIFTSIFSQGTETLMKMWWIH